MPTTEAVHEHHPQSGNRAITRPSFPLARLRFPLAEHSAIQEAILQTADHQLPWWPSLLVRQLLAPFFRGRVVALLDFDGHIHYRIARQVRNYLIAYRMSRTGHIGRCKLLSDGQVSNLSYVVTWAFYEGEANPWAGYLRRMEQQKREADERWSGLWQ